jgi:hypothetical protein
MKKIVKILLLAWMFSLLLLFFTSIVAALIFGGDTIVPRWATLIMTCDVAFIIFIALLGVIAWWKDIYNYIFN